jgi:hypothetical protein
MSSPWTAPPPAGALSPDRQWYWDGSGWVPAVSPDGYWRWDGSRWQANAPAGPAATVPSPWPAWARPYASASNRATFVVLALAALVVALALWTIVDVIAVILYQGSGRTLAKAAFEIVSLSTLLAALLFLVAYVISIVAWCMWMHRVYRNLPALGAVAPKYSPAWAAGSWFVPILNLFRPYQVVRDIWQTLAPGVPWTLLIVWWWFFLGGNWAANAVGRVNIGGGADEALDAVVNLVLITGAVLAVLVVRRITGWQEGRARQATAR